jgi:aerobic carbon-monoxide dehydrogenase large subunit
MGEFAIGQSVRRFEDPRLVRGRGRYVGDMVLPGMAYGYVLRSSYAHARIRSIEAQKARAASGVLAIFTGADWETSGWGDLPVPGGLAARDGSQFKPRYPALVRERVRWVGDYVAFVVAETFHQAMDAAELIAVDYEPLPVAVVTAEVSSGKVAPVWDGRPNNIGFVQLFGDKAATDAAFAKAAHVTKQEFVINRVTAASMETRGALGDYNAGDNRYTLYATLQRAHTYRSELAAVMKVPEAKVHVVAGDIGGAFGMKSALYNEVVLVLLASKVIGRPVKWVSTRSESFLSDAQARDHVTTAELALDDQGRFLGMRATVVAGIGAYLQVGMPAFTGNIGTLAGVYRIPAMFADVTAVYSHTNPIRPYRGNGRPEAAYVIERLIDIAADELSIDPVELRRRNYIPSDAMPFKTALTFTYDCGEFERNMDIAVRAADVDGFAARREKSRMRGKLRGIGLSNTIERAAGIGFEAAEIRFDKSGTATLFSGSINQGQGHETIFKQILCDRLGLDPDHVHYEQGDTDTVFLGEGTAGSRSATLGGSAVALAAARLIAKATVLAAHLLELDPSDLNFADGVFSSPRSNRTLSIRDVARQAMQVEKLPSGMDVGLGANATYIAQAANFPNGCHICELEIDEETGAIDIQRYTVVDDVGTVLNPLLLKGQIVGGVAQGVGQILMEDIHFDDEGQMLTGSFMDYAMPRATDMCAVEVESNPVPTKTNPLGVKGAGEAGCVGAMPAVANAIVDALSHLGVRHVEMPATPERIWRAISAHAHHRDGS